MAEPLDKSFVEEMREKLNEQLSEFELAKKREEHDARIVSDEGPKKWLELKECMKNYIKAINDRFPDPLLSYSDNANPNELDLTHELTGRDIQITFDPASAVISYKGGNDEGEFRPRVRGDALEYRWDETTRGGMRIRAIDVGGDDEASVTEAPVLFPTERMSEIILRRVVTSKG
jgi:hypothetical protein